MNKNNKNKIVWDYTIFTVNNMSYSELKEFAIDTIYNKNMNKKDNELFSEIIKVYPDLLLDKSLV